MSFVSSPYSRNVYVASLSIDYTDDQLRVLFEPFGKIISCAVKRDRATGLCKGYGFVLFERDEDACNAVIGLQGHSICFTRIQVRLARPEASAKKVMPVVAQQQALQQAVQQAFQPYYFMMMQSMPTQTSVISQ
ncbi:CUGBP Elav-like family member 3 [Bactrocera neohumeralis]|uniref:CUGBP Elav-like family member 3 n=1 Tax=Bactrocera neohumeralis TaxID=98809 RepID=UPI002166625E|nr:CUGBP Elav-like family member 3 [Bactrocera neohumeralis]